MGALEKLVADPHLLEDLCFGPTWPQLCDSLGRLVCLLPPSGGTQAAVTGAGHHQHGHTRAAAAVGGGAGRAAASVPEMPKQQQLLLQALNEVRSTGEPGWKSGYGVREQKQIWALLLES